MAGIEKICEFSGNYPGWEMYNYKHNHIQIEPKWRELFTYNGANKDVILYVYRKEYEKDPIFGYRDGCIIKHAKYEYYYYLYTPNLPKALQYLHLFNDEGKEFKVTNTYWYNLSYDLRAVKHKLAKLVGIKNAKMLPIKFIKDEDKFYKLIDN